MAEQLSLAKKGSHDKQIMKTLGDWQTKPRQVTAKIQKADEFTCFPSNPVHQDLLILRLGWLELPKQSLGLVGICSRVGGFFGYPGIPIIDVTGKILHMSAPTPGQHPTDLFGAVPHSSSFSKAVQAVQVATTSAWGSWAASSVKRLRHFKCSNAWATSLCELEEIEMSHNC